MVLRRQWVSEHPPQFNRTSKQRAAAAMGGRLRPRLSFQLWLIRTFQPERWKELERRARQGEKSAEREAEAREADLAREAFVDRTQ